MNAGLHLHDLAPADRKALIDRASRDITKSLQLTRITRFLNSLPAPAEVTPSVSLASAVAGTSPEQHS